MADSLKDQLLHAGFEEAKPTHRKKPKKTAAKQNKTAAKASNSTRYSTTATSPGKSRTHHAKSTGKSAGKSAGKSGKPKKPPILRRATNARFSTPPNAEDAAKKSRKARVQALIETHEIKDSAGEILYRYVLDSRIRELRVNEVTRQRLLDGDLTITRLNGTTRIVTRALCEQILELNPDWSIARIATDDDHEASDDYKDFPIPDDLQW